MDITDPGTAIPAAGTTAASVGGYIVWRTLNELKRLVETIRNELRQDMKDIDASLEAAKIQLGTLQQQRKEDFSRLNKMDAKSERLDERIRSLEMKQIQIEGSIVRLSEGHVRHRQRIEHLENNRRQVQVITEDFGEAGI